MLTSSSTTTTTTTTILHVLNYTQPHLLRHFFVRTLPPLVGDLTRRRLSSFSSLLLCLSMRLFLNCGSTVARLPLIKGISSHYRCSDEIISWAQRCVRWVMAGYEHDGGSKFGGIDHRLASIYLAAGVFL
jgi:hypothetical protein